MGARLACISVDLDSLQHYCRIYGLSEGVLDARARGLIYTAAVPRFLELFAELDLPGTFFAIGEDLQDERCARALAQAHQRGVEIGNHTQRHDYALSRRSPALIAADIAQGAQAIFQVLGRAPEGFRAPGYTLSAALYQE